MKHTFRAPAKPKDNCHYLSNSHNGKNSKKLAQLAKIGKKKVTQMTTAITPLQTTQNPANPYPDPEEVVKLEKIFIVKYNG